MSETGRARPSGSSSRPPSGQRVFALHGGDLGVEQFVVPGDLAHLGFQPGDLIVALITLTFLQGRRRAGKRRSRHSVSLATETFASRATKSNGSPRNKRATTASLRWTE